MAWKAGMKAKCIKRGPWRYIESGQMDGIGPRYGEELDVERVGVTSKGLVVLSFVEYPGDVFTARRFRPLTKSSKTLEADRELFRKIADSAPKELVRDETPQVSA